MAVNDVLIGIKTEAEAKGLSELEKEADAILKIAGSGSLASESLITLTYILETLQNSTGFKSLDTLEKKLSASLKSIGKISKTKGSTGNDYIKNYKNTVNNVSKIKVNDGIDLTKEEQKIYKKLKQKITNINEVMNRIDDYVAQLLEDFNNDIKPLDLQRLSNTRLNYSKIKSQGSIDKNRDVRTKREEIKLNIDKIVYDLLEEQGLLKQYAQDKIDKAKANTSLTKIRAENAERKQLRKKVFNSFGGDVRAGLLGLEDRFQNRQGAVGFGARVGANLANRIGLGDVLNMGVKGAGVNLGSLIGGGLAIGVSKLAKAEIELSKASQEAFGEIEKLRTGLSVTFGNQGEADKLFSQISTYAVKSPFSVSQTTEQATLLRGSGVSSYEIMDTLKMLGDIAGGNQDKMTRLSNNYAQIVANGTATARNLRQFSMAGVPIYDALSKVLGTDQKNIMSKTRKGEVTSQDVAEALKLLTSENGPFYKSVEKGARTYAARSLNLQDTKQLALAARGENQALKASNDLLKLREDWWNQWKEIYEGNLKNVKEKRTTAIDDRIDEIDKAIVNAQNSGDIGQVKLLKVYKMEVEKMSDFTPDQREQINANKYESAQKSYTENLIKLQNIATLRKELGSTEFGSIRNRAAYFGLNAYGFNANDYNYTDEIDGSSGLNYLGRVDEYIEKINQEAEKAFKTLEETSNKFYISASGNRMERTRENIASTRIYNRSALRTSSERLSDILERDKKSGVNNNAWLEDFYSSTVEGKADKVKEEQEKIDYLKQILKEQKELNLIEEKFAYAKQGMSAEDFMSKYKDFYQDTGKILNFDTDEQFKESQNIISDNLKNIKDIFANAYGKDLYERTGMSNGSSSMISVLNSLLNANTKEDAGDALQRFIEMLSSSSDAVKQWGDVILNENKAILYDEKKINSHKKSSEKYYLNTQYSNLLKRELNSTFGVSLESMIGADFGTKEHDVSGGKSTLQLTGNIRNKFDRALNERVAMAMLGLSTTKMTDVSKFISQGSVYNYSRYKQDRYDKNGNFISGDSFGNKRFNFVNQGRTAGNFTSYALSKDTDISVTQALLASYEDQLSKLNTFIAKSFTEGENQEDSYELRRLRAAKYSREGSDEYNYFVANKEKYEQLEEQSMKKQLGYGGFDEDAQKEITALAHNMYEASDGTLTYTEAINNAINKLREEAQEQANYTKIIIAARQAVEKMNDQINKSQYEGYESSGAIYSTDLGKKYKRGAVKNIYNGMYDFIAENKNLLESVYYTKNPIEILSNLKTSNGTYGNIDLTSLTSYQNAYKQYDDYLKNSGKSQIDLLNSEDPEFKKIFLDLSTTTRQLSYLLGKKQGETFLKFGEDEFGNPKTGTVSGKPLFSSNQEAQNYWIKEQGDDLIKYATNNELNNLIKKLNTNYFFTEQNKSLGSLGILNDSAYRLNNNNARGTILNSNTLYMGNDWRQQNAMDIVGLPEKSIVDFTNEIFGKFDEDGNLLGDQATGVIEANTDSILSLIQILQNLGYGTKELIGAGIVDKEGNIATNTLNIEQQSTLGSLTANALKKDKSIKAAQEQLTSLKEMMKDTFDKSIVDGISRSCEALGESLATGADSAEAMGKALRDVAANMLKTIGPAMTETGLKIAAAAATEKPSDWGRVAGGLGLAAAGGFLSWSGGLMSDKGNDSDKDSQREERLKSLADLLGDLIDQARTDAEYYERNMLHRQALAQSYDISSRSVNDMIITPEGNFSTHPEDTIMAMKHPEDLINRSAGSNTVVNFKIINNSSNVKVEEKRTVDENGNVDIQAFIIDITKGAIASGEMDDALGAAQSRQQGMTRVG